MSSSASNPASDRLDAFFDEYYAISQAHPWDAREQCWEDSSVFTEISKFDGDVHISSIATSKQRRRSGAATRVLQRLTVLADKHRVTMTLMACPIGKGGPGKRKLMAWYAKHGFKSLGSEYMVRTPKEAEHAAQQRTAD